MNRPRPGRTNQRRRPQTKQPRPVDLWRTPEALPEVEPILVASDPGALLTSLGDPPMGGGTAAGEYFRAVVERAAALAHALALSADLVAEPDPD